VTGWLWFGVAAAGGTGAVLRHLVDSMMLRKLAQPTGTLVVNVSGSFVLGVVTGLALYHAFPSAPRLLIGAGVCGAYTTFSGFALESLVLARRGERLNAVLHVASNLLGGCVAVAGGLALAAL
jgi:CrcB protein